MRAAAPWPGGARPPGHAPAQPGAGPWSSVVVVLRRVGVDPGARPLASGLGHAPWLGRSVPTFWRVCVCEFGSGGSERQVVIAVEVETRGEVEVETRGEMEEGRGKEVKTRHKLCKRTR